LEERGRFSCTTSVATGAEALYASLCGCRGTLKSVRRRLHKSFSDIKKGEEIKVYLWSSKNINRCLILKIASGVVIDLRGRDACGVVGVGAAVVVVPSHSLIASPAPISIAATTAPTARRVVGNPAVAHPARAATKAVKKTAIACCWSLNPVELLIFIPKENYGSFAYNNFASGFPRAVRFCRLKSKNVRESLSWTWLM
jgi:hypothetical protein